MGLWNKRSICLLAGFLLLASCGMRAFAAERPKVVDQPLDSCRKALAEVDAWLKQSSHAKVWDDYLQLSELRAALANASGTEGLPAKDAVTTAIHRLSVPAVEVRDPRFSRLRRALIGLVRSKFRSEAGELATHVADLHKSCRFYSAAEVDAAQVALRTALADLNTYLASVKSVEEGWKSYLDWETLEGHAAGSMEFDVDLLAGIHTRLHSGYPGLELPPFARTAQALDIYLRRKLAADTPEARAEIAAQCERLAGELQPLGKSLPEWSEQAAVALGWLELWGQHPEVVLQLRESVSRPNILIDVAADFLDAGMQQNVDRDAPVRDVILGTNISGMGHTLGEVRVKMVPDADRGVLELNFFGNTATRTLGLNGPVQIHSRGNVAFNGNARIILDERGPQLGTSEMCADSRSHTTGLCTTVRPLFDRLVRRIASKKIAKNQAQANWIASRHAEQQLIDKFNADIKKQLDDANRKYWKEIRGPMMAAGEFPRSLRYSTTRDGLRISVLQANRFQLAAPLEAPPIQGRPAMAVRLHQSSINNYFAGMWAGKTADSVELAAMQVRLTGKAPKKKDEDDDNDPWSITFADEQPVQVTLDDDGFKIVIQGQHYTSGQSNFGEMNIAAHYRFRRDGNNLVAVRQEDLQFYPPGFVPGSGQRLGARQIALKAILQRRLGKVLKPELVMESPFDLPDDWRDAGPLTLTGYHCNDGWLALDWHKQSPPVVAKAQARPK